MTDPEKIVRPNILSLKPYSCARDEYTGSEGIFLDANENPYGALNRYPDPYQMDLKKKVSELKGVPLANIFLGNGSDEIIDLTFRLFCSPGKDKALTFTPTYGMYAVSAGINDVEMKSIPLDSDFMIRESDIDVATADREVKLIILCSPNNPTGNLIKKETIEKILKTFNGIVLLDEAYNDFAGGQSFRYRIGEFPNLIVMQTFSKAFGMASVRVGMAFADSRIVSFFNKIKPPYNISTVNQKTILRAIGKEGRERKQVAYIIRERERLVKELPSTGIVKHIYPSDANFLLVKVNNADGVYNYLLDKGIIVRNRSSVVPGCIRITVGTRTENNRLLNALANFK